MAWAKGKEGTLFPRDDFACDVVGTTTWFFGGNTPKGVTNTIYTHTTTGLGAVTQIHSNGVAPKARKGHSMTAAGTKIYLFGGEEAGAKPNDQIVYVFNTALKAWSKPRALGTSPAARSGHSATLIGDKYFYIFGGDDGSAALNDIHSFEVGRNAWAAITPSGTPPSPRHRHGAAAVGQLIYIFGGTDGSNFHNDLFSFDTQSSVWTSVNQSGSVPSPRSAIAFVNISNKLWLFGGKTASGTSDELFSFDPSTSSWTQYASDSSTPDAREGHAMVYCSTKAFLYGGTGSCGLYSFQADKPVPGAGTPASTAVVAPVASSSKKDAAAADQKKEQEEE